MKCVFRADASVEIGTGHIMRCRTLANALRERGANVHFICRAHHGHISDLLISDGFLVTLLDQPQLNQCNTTNPTTSLGTKWETDAEQTIAALCGNRIDWLIVDHYNLDARWEKAVRPTCCNLMVIDDLADRPHDCDILLDQNFYQKQNQRYRGLLPCNCITLLGPDYILLRPEFEKAKQKSKFRNGSVKNILIFFGGTDPTKQTELVLAALEIIDATNIEIDVVVGSTNPRINDIKIYCDKRPSIIFHCNTSIMANLVSKADLAIGAGGVAMWERCFLGLPTITVSFAYNQIETTEDVAKTGAIKYIGRSDSVNIDDYLRAIIQLLDDPDELKRISKIASSIVREPGTHKVVTSMLEMPRFNSPFISA